MVHFLVAPNPRMVHSEYMNTADADDKLLVSKARALMMLRWKGMEDLDPYKREWTYMGNRYSHAGTHPLRADGPRLSVVVQPVHLRAYRAAAKRRGITMAALVREAMEALLEASGVTVLKPGMSPRGGTALTEIRLNEIDPETGDPRPAPPAE